MSENDADYSGTDLAVWDPEDDEFWESTGKAIATRNLWISIPSLLCGFAVWLMWGIITVQMKNLGFDFTQAELFTLSAIAGLTGATLRIPSTFFIRLAGGRNTIFFTTALLMIPALGAAITLQNPDTPLYVFQLLAFLSGIGGGNFASSMSNISFFYPKKVQGYALGMNAGLGNFGVTTMQILIPLGMTAAIVGPLSGDSMILETTSGTIFKQIEAGSETWLSSAGWVWMYWLVPLAFLGWTRMNNITTDAVTPGLKSPFTSFGRILFLLGIGFLTAGIGLWLILTFTSTWTKWIVLPCIIAATVFLMKKLSPGEIKENLDRQYQIFDNKHTWVMTVIYTMTFGSFIGFSAAVGLAIKFIFGFQHLMVDGVMTHDTVNLDGPSALMYAWMGPFIGALIRPIGGVISDKVGGAIVTQVVAVVMTLSTIGVGYYSAIAYQSGTPQDYFTPFIILIIILFAATGVGNGSTFRTISVIYDKEQAGPALGWTSAVAAYGAFLIPKLIGEQMAATTPEYAFYGLAAFYAICAVINWWYYLGPKRDYDNP